MKMKKQNGRLSVRLKKWENQLHWVIEDNGVGRSSSSQVEKNANGEKHNSSGIRLTKERLRILSQKTNLMYHMEIEDLVDAENNPAGTRVSIIMPFDEAN